MTKFPLFCNFKLVCAIFTKQGKLCHSMRLIIQLGVKLKIAFAHLARKKPWQSQVNQADASPKSRSWANFFFKTSSKIAPNTPTIVIDLMCVIVSHSRALCPESLCSLKGARPASCSPALRLALLAKNPNGLNFYI